MRTFDSFLKFVCKYVFSYNAASVYIYSIGQMDKKLSQIEFKLNQIEFLGIGVYPLMLWACIWNKHRVKIYTKALVLELRKFILRQLHLCKYHLFRISSDWIGHRQHV